MIVLNLLAFPIKLMVSKTEGDLALFSIDFDYLRRDIVLQLKLFFELRGRLQAGFAHMNQSLNLAIEFDENPKVGNLCHLASH